MDTFLLHKLHESLVNGAFRLQLLLELDITYLLPEIWHSLQVVHLVLEVQVKFSLAADHITEIGDYLCQVLHVTVLGWLIQQDLRVTLTNHKLENVHESYYFLVADIIGIAFGTVKHELQLIFDGLANVVRTSLSTCVVSFLLVGVEGA